jgi:hypothetical protein
MVGVALFLQSKDFASFIAAIGDRQKLVELSEGRIVFNNLKAMPGILKWLTAVCLVPPIFFLGTLIPNGSINVNGRPMLNSVW